MSLIDRIFRRANNNFSLPMMTGGNWIIPTNRSTEGYLRAYGEVGWLFAVVNKIAVSFGDTKWRTVRIRRDGEKEVIPDHPLTEILKRSNPIQTGSEVRELAQMYIDLVGECFLLIGKNAINQPIGLFNLPPHRMSPIPDEDKLIAGYIYDLGDRKIPFEVDEIIHIKQPNPHDQMRGIGAVQSLAVDIDTESYASRWNRNVFYNNGMPEGILKLPRMAKEDYEKAKEKWQSDYGGIGNARKTAVVTGSKEDTIDYKQIMLSPKDMDFGELRKMTRDNILGVFGMPASLMGIEGVGSRARAEEDNYMFAKWVLSPRLNRYKESINEKLAPLFGSDIEVEYEDPVPENKEMILKGIEVGIGKGVMTVNEARALLGLDERKDGDVLLIPSNVIPTDESGKVSSPLEEGNKRLEAFRRLLS